MLSDERIDLVLETLGRHWRRHRNWRLEQMLENSHGCCAYYLTDEALLEALTAMDGRMAADMGMTYEDYVTMMEANGNG